ncbi:MAG: glycoside hydrolase family 43 protein [Solirubrobacteraceae bacterium]
MRSSRLIVLISTLALAVAGAYADADTVSAPVPVPKVWHNPIVAGDFPDPSAARVGGVYWATSTSSAGAPGFPLLQSADLVHWTRVGSVFRRPPRWAKDSLWAPELAVGPDGVRLYYAARRRDGRLCVAVASAPAPQGPYTDHGPLVCQPAGSIDPAEVRDAAGHPYLVWKEDGNAVGQPSRIWIKRLRSNRLGLIGPRRELLRNRARWEGAVVEAPEIVARDGWLYLFYSGNAYGPPRCSYALGVARARSIFGPWVRDPANPILRSNAGWRCPGHASIVDDGAGRDFVLYHAYRSGENPFGPRMAMLDLLEWTADDWPQINGGRGPSTETMLP